MNRVCIVRQRDYGELSLQREAEALRDAGFAVDVVCMAEAGMPRREVLEGITVHRLPLGRTRAGKVRYVLDYLAFFALASVWVSVLHLRHRFAAVQVNTMPDVLVFCAALPKWTGAKVVAFMKEPTPELGELLYGPGRWPQIMRRIEQWVLSWADVAITVTDDLKDTYVLRGADPDKIHVVLNGPSAEAFTDPEHVAVPDPEHFTLLCHGAIEERYGHESVLRAVAIARADVPNLRFRITGDGTAVEQVRALISELDLADCVDMLGFVSMAELSDELGRADIGVVAQLQNGYSDLVHTNKMYEYMRFSIPVIAGRLRSVSRYFGDDSVCWFEAGDPDSLAEAIVSMHRDVERRERMVRTAHELFAQYRWERQREHYLDAFAAVGVQIPSRSERTRARLVTSTDARVKELTW